MGKSIRDPKECIGKKVSDIDEGFEDVVIMFEDGTEYRIHTGVPGGNPRDI